MSRLLIVAHAPTRAGRQLVTWLREGADHPDIDGVEVVVTSPFEVGADDVRSCDGIILCTPANFGYMSGALKDFFDRSFRDLDRHGRPLPYGLLVRGESDGTGAVASVERIVTALGWRPVVQPLVVIGPLDDEVATAVNELGATVAAGLSIGLHG